MSLSPVHPAVLGAAALIASPALWLSLVAGNLPLPEALIRFLVVVPVCWIALNVVATWFLPDRQPGAPGAIGEAGPDARATLAHPSTSAETA